MLAASLASTHSMPVTTHSRHSRCLGSKLHPTTTTTGDPDLKHWTLFSLCCWLRHSYLASLKAPIKHTWLVNFTVMIFFSQNSSPNTPVFTINTQMWPKRQDCLSYTHTPKNFKSENPSTHITGPWKQVWATGTVWNNHLLCFLHFPGPGTPGSTPHLYNCSWTLHFGNSLDNPSAYRFNFEVLPLTSVSPLTQMRDSLL